MRHALIILVLYACVGCGNSRGTPTTPSGNVPPACADYSGSWSSTHVDQCGIRTTATVMVSQSGCQLRVNVPDIGDFTMEITATQRQVQITKAAACQNLQLPGTADELTATSIHVIYGSGPDGCCRHGGLTLRR